MSGREQGPTWREMAYQAAIDAALGRIQIDPDAYLEAMEQNPGAVHLVSGPGLEDDCEICRKLRERGEPALMVLPDGTRVDAWGPRGRR